MGGECIDINRRRVSVNLQNCLSKFRVRIILCSIHLFTHQGYKIFMVTTQPTSQNIRALWFSANGFPQNWTLFQLFRNESPCILCFQFCFTWNWIVPISLPKSFHYCWMHVRTAIGCCLSFTLMLGILRAF